MVSSWQVPERPRVLHEQEFDAEQAVEQAFALGGPNVDAGIPAGVMGKKRRSNDDYFVSGSVRLESQIAVRAACHPFSTDRKAETGAARNHLFARRASSTPPPIA